MTETQTDVLDDGGLSTARPSSIQTWRGRVDPLNPVVDDIDIDDIAHALARQCRYNGHCEGYLSVARHSIWVSYVLELQGYDVWTQLTGLLHDAAEAYLGDLVRPIKQSSFGVEYLKVEAVLEEAIAERFGLAFPFPEAVREADNYVLTRLELPDMRYNYLGEYGDDEDAFLDRYEELRVAIRDA